MKVCGHKSCGNVARVLEHLRHEVLRIGNRYIDDRAVGIPYRLEFRLHKTRVGWKVERRYPLDDLVAENWIEVDTIGLKQLFGRFVVIRCTLANSRPTPSWNSVASVST